MSFDGTKQQELSGKAMASSQFATQGTADEHTPGVTCDDKTAPTTFDKTALISGTGFNPPNRYMPDDIQHGLGDVDGSTTHSAELANDSHQVQVNGNELIENDNGLYPSGQAADEQNLEVDVSYALLSFSYKNPCCVTRGRRSLYVDRTIPRVTRRLAVIRSFSFLALDGKERD